MPRGILDTSEPHGWGNQDLVVLEAGATKSQRLLNLGPPPGQHDQVDYGRRPLGLWRVSIYVSRQDNTADRVRAVLSWGSGINNASLENVLLPCVAFVPGTCQAQIIPTAALLGALEVVCQVTTVHGYSRQRVSTLEGTGLLPPTTVAVQSLDAATTVQPQGATAPIPLALGARLEFSGPCVVVAGSVVAEHEL